MRWRAYSLLSFYTVSAVEAETLTETMARSHMRRARLAAPVAGAATAIAAAESRRTSNYSGLHSGCIDLQS